MKKLLVCTLLLIGAISAFAQDEEKEIKKGWSFGVLPTATFSADNGFQAGAFGDVYYYGDGNTYPDPLHKISWEGSYFTKSHRMRLYLAYDSKYLIPGMRVNTSVTYMNDPLYSFWGFNGPASFDSGVTNSFTSVSYPLWGNRSFDPNINYYGMSRQMLRILANVQGRITDNLNWAAGINFWNWTLGEMKDPAVDGKNYDHSLTLLNKYKELGAIKAEEAAGGMSVELNAGFVFDTRDIEAAPNRGIWAEAYLNGAPYAGNASTGLYSPYLKACTYFRHYISIPVGFIKAGDPVFAYRLAWQQTIAGETPFYMIQNNPLLVQRNMISEGFGSSNTIRGLRENRVLAEGMAWANTELRVKLVSFKLANQFFYVAVNPFFDAGIITKAYREDVLRDKVINDPALLTITGYNGGSVIYDHDHYKDLIYSGGMGLKIAMNQNFIVSAEFAKCFTPGLDAGLWLGIGINYQF